MNLQDTAELKRACDLASEAAATTDWYQGWAAEVREILHFLSDAKRAERASKEFHARIWDDNPMAATGMGHVSVQTAVDDEGFRAWLADASLTRLPEAGEARVAALRRLYDELLERLAKYTDRTPRLKIFRVLAALF